MFDAISVLIASIPHHTHQPTHRHGRCQPDRQHIVRYTRRRVAGAKRPCDGHEASGRHPNEHDLDIPCMAVRFLLCGERRRARIYNRRSHNLRALSLQLSSPPRTLTCAYALPVASVPRRTREKAAKRTQSERWGLSGSSALPTDKMVSFYTSFYTYCRSSGLKICRIPNSFWSRSL